MFRGRDLKFLLITQKYQLYNRTVSPVIFCLLNDLKSTRNSFRQEPITRSLHYPIFLSPRFHRPIYFQFEVISNSDHHRNLSDQLQSQARTNVDNSACSCKAALFYSYQSVLMQTGKMIKNRLVCENAVELAYYGRCRLLLMDSCSHCGFFLDSTI